MRSWLNSSTITGTETGLSLPISQRIMLTQFIGVKSNFKQRTCRFFTLERLSFSLSLNGSNGLLTISFVSNNKLFLIWSKLTRYVNL